MTYLCYADNAVRLIGPLAEDLITELICVGKVCTVLPINRNAALTAKGAPVAAEFDRLLLNYLDRVAEIAHFLKFAEDRCDLRFRQGCRLPFLSVSSALDMAGYVADYPMVKPTGWTALLHSAWQRWPSGMEGGVTEALNAALLYTRMTSLDETFVLLGELVQTGFLPVDVCVGVVSLLLHVDIREETTSGDVMIAWLAANGGLPKQEAARAGARSNPTPAAGLPAAQIRKLINGLLEQVGQQINATHRAETFDDWLLHAIDSRSAILLAQSAVKATLDPVPLVLRTKLAQWEEIKADVGGLMLPIHLMSMVPEVRDLAAHQNDLVETFRARTGPGSDERFDRERSLTPYALRPTVLFGGTEPVPPGWERLGPSWVNALRAFDLRHVMGTRMSIILTIARMAGRHAPLRDTTDPWLRKFAGAAKLEERVRKRPASSAAHFRFAKATGRPEAFRSSLQLNSAKVAYWKATATALYREGAGSEAAAVHEYIGRRFGAARRPATGGGSTPAP